MPMSVLIKTRVQTLGLHVIRKLLGKRSDISKTLSAVDQ